MNQRIILILTTLLFISYSGIAQVEKQISLQEAISLSLKNSHQLKISNAKIDEALAQEKEALQERLPDFKISGNYLRFNSAKLNMKFASGGDSASHGGPKIPTVNQALYGSANLSFPLYAGGKLKYGFESAKLLAEAVKMDAESDTQHIILNTVQAYVNMYKAAKTITLLKENLNSSKSRDSTFSNLEKNGLLARNDLLKSQLQTSNIELALLNAENDSREASLYMNLLLGLPETNPLEVDTNFVNSNSPLTNFSDFENAAILNRADVRATQFRKKAAEAGVKAAKGQALPNIGLTAGYIAADIPNVFSVTNAVNAGIGIQYNLANIWKSNTQLKKAEARKREIMASQDMLTDEIKVETNRDYQMVLLSHKRIEVYERALEQANENFRITNNKYANSLVTLTDLLDADVARLQAKINITLAKADAVLAYYKLLQTAGLLKAL